MSRYYDSVIVNGVAHYISALAYDDSTPNNYAKVIMASFYTKQQHDQFLASIQKGTNFLYNSKRIYTHQKMYISNAKKCTDDNACDGYHAIIYAEEEGTIIVQKGENAEDKIFQYLKNYKSGLIDEWKNYFISTLISFGCITRCSYNDLTGGYLPEVYACKDINTELIRSIKSEGLKTGKITLPVANKHTLDPSMEFIDIIEKLIIPHITSEKCYYNVGEPISDVIKSKIIKDKRVFNLFKKQQIIAQGMLNYIKGGNNSILFNGGTGIGKTFTTIKLVTAIIKEHYKKKDAYIGVYCQSHLVNNWKNEFKHCLNPLGIYPKIHVINNYKDIRKLNKKPKGIEIIIMPKDRAKRSYTQNHSGLRKFTPTSDLNKYVSSIGNNSNNVIEVKKCNVIKRSKTKVAIAKYNKIFAKPILLYRETKDKKGKKVYECTTNSYTLKKVFGTSNKSYDFILNSVSDIKNAVFKYSKQIASETHVHFISQEKECYDYMICPHCGGKIYENPKFVFSDEYSKKFMKKPYTKSKNSRLAKCNNFLKADGSTITNAEVEMLKRRGNFRIVNDKTKVVYVDTDNNPLTGKDLECAKKGIGDFIIQIRKCNYHMFGALYQDQSKKKVTPSYNSAKYMRKLFGDNFLDVCIYDESHEYNKMSEQGLTMGYLCIASKINILLSGTITGGKASDLYYTLWRINPSKMKSLGYDFNSPGPFVDHYGRRKRISKERIDYTSSKSGQAKMVSNGWTEIAGISPLLYNNFLVDIMVSRKIEDMGIPLPPIKYIKEVSEMDYEQRDGYERLKSDLVNFMRSNPNISLGGTYVKKLKSYPDYPLHDDIYATDKDGNKIFVTTPQVIDISKKHLPKEKKLVSTLIKEVKQGRKVIVYTEFTGMGVSARLFSLLDKYFNVRELRSNTCKIEEREDLVERWAKEGVDVIICNPELVKTGLNLVSYPTMYFYDQTYKIETLRQAEMRAYRPLQKNECRIYYAFYKDSIQEDAIKLIGTKKKASLALEGVFSNDMLSSMGDGGDTIESMLNKVLDGKIVLKESDLDAFQFETVDYTITEDENAVKKEGNTTIIDVVPTPVKERPKSKPKTNNTMFELNNDFLNKYRKLKEMEKQKTSNVSSSFMDKLNKLRGIEDNKEVAATSSEQISLFNM